MNKTFFHLHTAFRPVTRRTILAGLFAFCLFPVSVHAKDLYATDGVNVRSQPDSSSAVQTAISAGTAVTQTGTSGNWIAVQVDGINGYIYKDYLSSSPVSSPEEASSAKATGDSSSSRTYINSTEVNLRKKANGYCKIKAVLTKGEEVEVLSQTGNWTKIRRSDESVGYVYTIYLGENKPSVDSSSTNTRPSRAESIDRYRTKAIAYAESRLGDTYSQAKRDMSGYADCSSLVRDAFSSASGKCIGDTTTTQADTMNGYFYSIGKITDATPGDLVYHLSGDNHTGIYLGNGQVLHASQKAGSVTISSYDSGSVYWEYGCNAAAYCYEH